MRKSLSSVIAIIFILGITTTGFGQDNQSDPNKDKKNNQEVWNGEVVDLSIGINKISVPFLTTHLTRNIGDNVYDVRAWELELRTNYKSGFSSVHVFEVYNLSDNNVFPAKPNEDESDGWVASGRGYAYRYLMHAPVAPSITAKRFNTHFIFGGGFWLRHEAHRFRPIEKRDGYPLGVNMTAGYGLNLLLTENLLLSTDYEFQMNLFKELQLARFKVGLNYKFKVKS